MLCASLNWDAVELLNVKEGGLPNALGLVLQAGREADHQSGHHSFFRTVAFGHPGHVIYDHAKSIKADLIVMGKHGRSRFEELLLGSVSRHVIEQCFCDVLIVTGPVQLA